MKVLLVDDSRVNLFSMANLLSAFDDDSEIDMAQDVNKAYQLYSNGDYDLVVTDGDLSNQLTGPMLAQLILNKKPEQAIAAWTDNKQRQVEFQHVFKLSQPHAGVRMIWQKNVKQEQLALALAS